MVRRADVSRKNKAVLAQDGVSREQ